MSDEYSKKPYEKETGIPAGYTWSDMNTLKGAELEEQYKKTLEELAKQGGILGKIFYQASNKISNAAILYRIVQMIDKEKWVSMSSDVKGEIYEGLLQKNAEDVKSGAGQYFTGMQAKLQIGAGSEQNISVNIWNIVISLCNLLIIFLVVKKFLFGPVQKMLDAVIEYMPAPTDIPPIEGVDADGKEVVRHSSDEEPV